MRPEVRHIIMNRMKHDYRDMGDYGDNANNDMTYDSAYRQGYDSGYEDGRRGVRGSGRRMDRMHEPYEENDDDEDYEPSLKLSKKVREHWLHNLRDKHGNKGPRFSKDEVMDAAKKMQVEFEDYTPADLYLMTNVLYSDCTVFRPLTSKDKEVYHWVAAAQEWLEDEDATLKGSEKVVSYYYNVANG